MTLDRIPLHLSDRRWFLAVASLVVATLVCTVPTALGASYDTIKVTGKVGGHLERSDVYFMRLVSAPRAILVLCPGQNQNGIGLFKRESLLDFAEASNMDIAAISFASPDDILQEGGGYFAAAAGSGAALLSAVEKTYGRPLPIVLYGYSGGARFVASFISWNSSAVLAWCAYSATFPGDQAVAEDAPPGIVACGSDDAHRFDASFRLFMKGRRLDRNWAWVALQGVDHEWPEKLDGFVVEFFRGCTDVTLGEPGGWWDIDYPDRARDSRGGILSAWIPSEACLIEWRKVHAP